jgi:hypothetical protein
MEHLNLNCASLDLIKDVNSEYILLEINVTGQFGMVDFPCNYGLHKKDRVQRYSKTICEVKRSL